MRDCVYLVTHAHFRSRDEDGGHTIRSALAKKPHYTSQTSWLCVIEGSCWRAKFGEMGFSNFYLFCSCDLNLDLEPMALEMHRICKYELPTSRFSKVVVWQTYIQTYIQTDKQTDRETDRETRPKLYTTPLREWSTSDVLVMLVMNIN